MVPLRSGFMGAVCDAHGSNAEKVRYLLRNRPLLQYMPQKLDPLRIYAVCGRSVRLSVCHALRGVPHGGKHPRRHRSQLPHPAIANMERGVYFG